MNKLNEENCHLFWAPFPEPLVEYPEDVLGDGAV